MPIEHQISVTTEARRKGDAMLYVATANVRYRHRDGRHGTARFEFVHQPFRSADEAAAYAREATLRHLRSLLMAGAGLH